MKTIGLVAIAQTTINARVEVVWDALTNPDTIKKYMFGTTVISDWREGSEIVWKGKWKGKTYNDKGKIVEFNLGKKLQYTHYSPLSGQPDTSEKYHNVTISLTEGADKTDVVLTQDNNLSEEAKLHAEKNWATMLKGLKSLLEQS